MAGGSCQGEAHRRGDLLGHRPLRRDRTAQDLALRHRADRAVTGCGRDRRVQEARGTGVAYLVAGALYLLFGLRGLMKPQMLPYEPPPHPFVHQYGMGIAATTVGVVFALVGMVLFRQVTP